ncbi:MAG: glucosaminidase domain-containing protein [Bacteroidales bacterium]|nr:glucosaminidase domain-containing protein [Bacteroidales bacterium]
MLKSGYLKWTLFFLLLIFLNISCKEKMEVVELISKNIDSSNDIVDITDSLVLPYDYLNSISLDSLPVDEKKQKFIDLIIPAVLVAKHNLEQEQMEMTRLMSKDTNKLKVNEKEYIQSILEKYKTENIDDLNKMLHTHPTSIVIAQAAIESGWGTSRFFVEANNIFGIWTYNSDIPSIKALGQRSGKTIYLKKYPSLSKSIESYFFTIALGPYSDFRSERLILDDPYKLIPYLTPYSERGAEYVEQIRIVLNKNDLVKYDNYIIDPKYIK